MKYSKKKVQILLSIIIILPFLFYYNNSVIETTYIDYNNSKLPSSFDGLRIVHLSDLHNKSFGKNQANLIDKVKNENPDLVLITGDIVDRNSKNADNALSLAEELTKFTKVYYVSGNHETSGSQFKSLKEGLEERDVIILDDKQSTISIGSDVINLWGISNNSLATLPYDYDKYTSLDNTEFNMLIAHKPEYLEDYQNIGFDLGFAGHAHGGQIRIPFINQGIIAPGQGLFPKYTEGINTIDDFSLIISRGLGNSGFPLRLFNRPEVIVVTLHK